MPISRCRQCGSTSFRADRSLAGRLICNGCGSPMGTRPNSRVNARNLSIRGSKKVQGNNWRFWAVAIIVLLVVLLLFR